MPTTYAGPPYSGGLLLEAVTEAMVAFHERYYHRAPGSAQSQLIDGELLCCVMGGVYTDVEKTLIELHQSPIVQGTRSAFQEAMRDRLVAEVHQLSGRPVLLFMSSSHVGPDMEIEIFLLGSGDLTSDARSMWAAVSTASGSSEVTSEVVGCDQVRGA